MEFARKPTFAEELLLAKQQAAEAAAESKEPWETSLSKSLITDRELNALAISPRLVILDSWLLEGDLGFIFASRGVGKTWIGVHLASCIAEGRSCGPWEAPQPVKVLYMDGEMPLSDMQSRNRVLNNCTGNLSYLSHELVFERCGRVLDLSDTGLQKAVLELCASSGYKVLVLDNLSTLVTGIDENKAIDWEKILPWLLRLRRSRVTVIFIHHAGVDAERMRGTSKREDPASWIIRLRQSKDDPEKESSGARFITSFEKCRNSPLRPKDLQWEFTQIPNGELLVKHTEMSPMDVFLELVRHGVDQCKTIAEEMELSEATVSRLAQKAEQSHFIVIRKRRYEINPTGSAAMDYE